MDLSSKELVKGATLYLPISISQLPLSPLLSLLPLSSFLPAPGSTEGVLGAAPPQQVAEEAEGFHLRRIHASYGGSGEGLEESQLYLREWQLK